MAMSDTPIDAAAPFGNVKFTYSLALKRVVSVNCGEIDAGWCEHNARVVNECFKRGEIMIFPPSIQLVIV